MLKLPLNVWILTIAQALMMSVSSVVVLIGGLIGAKLAPDTHLSTLPVALAIVGMALTVIPITLLMKRIGRKKTFLLVAMWSVANAIFMSYAVTIGSFYLVCLGALLFGVTTACVMQFRFAAMESVSSDFIPVAASCVLLGGIASAFIGPELAIQGKDLLKADYAGSFLLMAGVFVVAFLLLLIYKNVEPRRNEPVEESRSIKEISSQRVFWVAILSATIGYVIMSFIMTATPVSMHIMDGHSVQDTKTVIQSHILAMFLPSLVSGWLIRKIGTTRMMVFGLSLYLICMVIAYSGHLYINYWISLVLLGAGWNFLFVAGTTLLPTAYRQSERFKVQAVNDFVVFGSQAFASLSAGWLVFSLGWEPILLLTVPVILAQFLVVFNWSRRSKKANK